DRAALQRMSQLLGDEFGRLGGVLSWHRQEKAGDHLQISFQGVSTQPVLLLGHYDTVYSVGTLQGMPIMERGGKLYGPGVFDMKAGIAMMWHAVAALKDLRGGLPRPVTILLVSDEAVGSESSRALTESLAKKHAAVLVLEPAFGPKGSLKTSRKGVGEFKLVVSGVSAHAGLDFTKGHSAINELARQIERLSHMTNL